LQQRSSASKQTAPAAYQRTSFALIGHSQGSPATELKNNENAVATTRTVSLVRKSFFIFFFLTPNHIFLAIHTTSCLVIQQIGCRGAKRGRDMVDAQPKSEIVTERDRDRVLSANCKLHEIPSLQTSSQLLRLGAAVIALRTARGEAGDSNTGHCKRFDTKDDNTIKQKCNNR
jgi:hypothetical protein